ERIERRARPRLPLLDARRDENRENQLAVFAHRTPVEVERHHAQHARAMVRLDRLKIRRQYRARVLGGHLEEADDRVAEMILDEPVILAAHTRIPSSRRTRTRIDTPSSSWSKVCDAEIDTRNRERCLATAG